VVTWTVASTSAEVDGICKLYRTTLPWRQTNV